MARKTIRLTSKMVDALGMTMEINDKPMMIGSHPRTQKSLASYGLADEHGYLTDQGRFVAYLASLGGNVRSWSREGLEASTRTWRNDRERDRWPNRLTLEEALATLPEPTPAKYSEIRITGRMAEALLHITDMSGEQRLSLNTLAGTTVGLMDRGLVRYNRELSRENGYTVHTLTPRGTAAREELLRDNWGCNPKTLNTEKLDRAAESLG